MGSVVSIIDKNGLGDSLRQPYTIIGIENRPDFFRLGVGIIEEDKGAAERAKGLLTAIEGAEDVDIKHINLPAIDLDRGHELLAEMRETSSLKL